MKNKTKAMMIGTVAAMLIVGGGAMSWNHVLAADPVATTDTAPGQPAPKAPPKEDGQRKQPGQGQEQGKGQGQSKFKKGPKEGNKDGDRPCQDPAAPGASAPGGPAPDGSGRPGGPGGPGGPEGPRNPGSEPVSTPQGDQTVAVSGGHDTDPVDHGRPVVLIAAALGVPTEVFREAFSGVTPAGLDRGPTDEEAQRNKAALLRVLAPYGITNDRLDEVSNYYRYNGKSGKIWAHTPASATAVITDGVLTGVTITNPGSGYSSPPTIKVKGPDGTIVNAVATLAYTTDFSTNDSIASITLQN